MSCSSLCVKTANFERTFKKSLSGLPAYVVKKANDITTQICEGQASFRDFHGKRMEFNRDVISVKIGQKHRLLMAETDQGFMPWQCLSHEKYSKVYMRINGNRRSHYH